MLNNKTVSLVILFVTLGLFELSLGFSEENELPLDTQCTLTCVESFTGYWWTDVLQNQCADGEYCVTTKQLRCSHSELGSTTQGQCRYLKPPTPIPPN